MANIDKPYSYIESLPSKFDDKDTIKELPLTFILRPFDFDTLSVRIFQYAGDERLAESILPSLIIICLGLIASLALIPSLNNRNK